MRVVRKQVAVQQRGEKDWLRGGMSKYNNLKSARSQQLAFYIPINKVIS